MVESCSSDQAVQPNSPLVETDNVCYSEDEDLSSIGSSVEEEMHDSFDSFTSSENEDDDSGEDSEEDMIPIILDALDNAQFEEVTVASDEYLDGVQSAMTIETHTATNADYLDALETSFEAIHLSDAMAKESVKKLDTPLDESLLPKVTLPQVFGLKKHNAPPLLCRHPEPYAGRDDDPMKLKEIATDTLIKMGIYSDEPDMSTRILFGPDHKIGKNLLAMVKQRKYSPFLPEFPCLHARKSRITIMFSAYKKSGLMQLLQYMRDDDSNEWASLISAHHIDVATRYVMRLAKAFRLAFIMKFSCELSEDEASIFFSVMTNAPDTDETVLTMWQERFKSFLARGKAMNGTFALHVNMMEHMDGIGALELAEKLGGEEGYNILLASTKKSLGFSFLNGATSYSPYSIQLLYHHYHAGSFYGHLKKCLFSTPLSEGGVNMSTDTKRELDHQIITKGFRSGSTMDSVMRRTALADDLSAVHRIREQQRHQQSKKKDNSTVSWTTTQVDINHIVPTVLLVLRRGALSLSPDPNPYNVYAKTRTLLSPSILDENCKEVGEFLIKRYIANERLFGCTTEDVPNPSTVTGPKDLVSRAVKSKGVTIKCATGAGIAKEDKTERQKREEKRKKKVSTTLQRVECLSSEMNACQALVKPDCTKPKVNKALSIMEALKYCLCDCLAAGSSKTAAKDKILKEHNLIFLRSNKHHPLPSSISSTVKVVTIEFAGVRFKSKAITGLDYIKSVESDYIQNIISILPRVDQIVVVEEKYSFTPDTFKAATRDQRVSSTPSIHHLKTGREMLSAERFDKGACITSPEGK